MFYAKLKKYPLSQQDFARQSNSYIVNRGKCRGTGYTVFGNLRVR